MREREKKKNEEVFDLKDKIIKKKKKLIADFI